MTTLTICELFKSIQGESTHAGKICTFVRLSGCNLNCSWCDTTYSHTEGTVQTIGQIVDQIEQHNCKLVEITGGEPLLQPGVIPLCKELISRNHTVLIETNGSMDISVLPVECIKIVDIKCPDSGAYNSFNMDNINHLSSLDECKFVLASKTDFDWAIDFVARHAVHLKATVLFSAVPSKLSFETLAQWIIDSNAPVRLNLQLHKIIWNDRRGV